MTNCEEFFIGYILYLVIIIFHIDIAAEALHIVIVIVIVSGWEKFRKFGQLRHTRSSILLLLLVLLTTGTYRVAITITGVSIMSIAIAISNNST